MKRIWAIAINTFREAVRDRVLYGVVGFATAILLFTLALAQLSLNQQERVVRDVGLASISIFSVIVAVFLGSSLLYKEIEKKTLYVILPKPIERHEFLIGKYVGITLTAMVFMAIMGSLQMGIAVAQRSMAAESPPGGRPELAYAALGLTITTTLAMAFMFRMRAKNRRTNSLTFVLLPLSFTVFAVAALLASSAGVTVGPLLAALCLDVGEVLVVAAIAMLFSSFSSPFLTGALTIGVWLMGRSAGEMATMTSSALPEFVRMFLRGLSWIVPNLNLFVPPHRALAENVLGSTPIEYVLHAMGYAVLYASILIALACIVWRKRDFL
jgi:ABC-type transport system involved in multi-copper enzyme maturation permease subunit